MSELNLERLECLKSILLRIPDCIYTLNMYDGAMSKSSTISMHKQLNEATTYADALGWAASDPEFVEQGLHLVPCGKPLYSDRIPMVAQYKEYQDIDAAVEFFGLCEKQAMFVFGTKSYRKLHNNDDYYPTPEDVIINIDCCIDDYHGRLTDGQQGYLSYGK